MPSQDPRTSTQNAPAQLLDVADCVPPRMRADARRNRARIIEAARTVFAETGADAQMDDVAAAAGVGVGTVYRHFPSKDALIGELLVQKFTTISTVIEETRDEGGDPGEQLLAGIERAAGQLERDLAIQHVLSGPQNPAVWAAAETTLQRLNHVSGELMKGGQASGTLRADLRIGDIRLLMCGVAATMADPSIAPQWRRHMRLMLDAMRGPGAAPSRLPD